MKKRLFTLSLVSLLSVAGLTSCVNAKTTSDGKQVIFTLNNKDYTADELLADYGNTTSGVEAYYNAIYNVLISNAQEVTADMETYASNQIDEFVKEVKSNATTNNKSYRDELASELEDKGLNSLDELRQTYILEQQKKTYEENAFNDSIKDWWEDPSTKHTTTTEKDDYIQNYTPYHVKHILVKLSNAGTSLYNGTVSETEAKKLSGVVQTLSNGNETFGQVAEKESEDTESAKLFGSLGIMDQSTSYVSEFKYGVYAMEAYYNSTVKEITSEQISKLNIPENVYLGTSSDSSSVNYNVSKYLHDYKYSYDETTGKGSGSYTNQISTIDYNEVLKLGDYASYTVATGGQTTVPTDTKYGDRKGLTLGESYYPRNIIYNDIFNNHRFSFIHSDTKLTDRWVAYSGGGYILADEKGNPIIVTRAGATDSYEGVHFIVIEQSPFWYDSSKLTHTKLKDYTNVSADQYLDYYYSTELPSTDEAEIENDRRYVTYIISNRTTYTNRAEAIKTDIKNYDEFSQYRLYKELVNEKTSDGKDKIKFTDDSIKTKIEKWIDNKIEQSKVSKEKSNYDTWKSFIELLALQDAEEVKKVPYTDAFLSLYGASR